VTVEVPASSANLGVGYDVLALALDLKLRVTAEIIAAETTLAVSGEGAEQLRANASNRFLAGFAAGWREVGEGPVPTLGVEMANQIPLGRGLGSSAAATVGGILAAHALSGQLPGGEGVLSLAAEIEGHADNAAASLHGGFVVVADGSVVRYDPPPMLRAVVFIPDRQLATDEMRAVLPPTVPHADAVHNLGRTALLVSAFAMGDLSLLGAMYDDRLHEPYRAAAYPELPLLVSAARRVGALGAALSGAGSSVIALCEQGATGALSEALEAAAVSAGLIGRSAVLRPSGQGARVVG
jgi:homoserine kinase